MVTSLAKMDAEVTLERVQFLPADLPAEAGFKSGLRGMMTSRTIMLAELRMLLAALPPATRIASYRAAIVEDNVLLKRSAATRRSTAQRLAELYALDPGVPVFRLLRMLWDAEEAGRPLLACLCANARDPLLRSTAPLVLATAEGSPVHREDVMRSLAAEDPDRFSLNTLDTVTANVLSSWQQSGHLRGKRSKSRARARATPASTAYALALGYLAGVRGALLLDTYWTALLDAPAEAIDSLAFEAGRRGWLTYRRIGNVADLGFGVLLEEGVV
jgi:hypothetical protein